MTEIEIPQHVQVPSNVNMEPDERVLYAYIKTCMDKNTLEAYPSFDWIKKKTYFSKTYITKLLQSLEVKGFLSITKRKGTSNIYKFNPWVKFEPFSTEFLNDETTSKDEKKFIICAQEHMIINPETHCGKISYSDNKLAEATGLTRRFIKKCNNSLQEKDFMSILPLKSRDEETKLTKAEKIYYLDEFKQAVAYTLQRHDLEIKDLQSRQNETDKDMEIMKRTILELQQKLDSYEKKANSIIL